MECGRTQRVYSCLAETHSSVPSLWDIAPPPPPNFKRSSQLSSFRCMEFAWE